MSESVQAAQEVAQEAEVVVVSDPVFINTDAGAVAVFGHELVSKKDLVILAQCLTLEELSLKNGGHGVKSVVFRDDNFPKSNDSKPILASCSFDVDGISINLLHTFTKCVEVMLDNEPDSSIHAIWHRNMILNYLHEIHHLNYLNGDPMSDEEVETAEELAKEWSKCNLIELAQNVDIEPSHHAESSFFAGQLMELLAENTEDWAVAQRDMLENHSMFHIDENKDHGSLTLNFKGYMHLWSGDEVDDKKWNKETILGAGEESPLAASVRAANTEADIPVETVAPVQETPVVGGLPTSEYDEMSVDPNTMVTEGFGGNAGEMAEPAPVAQPSSAQPMFQPAQPAAPAAPTNNAFPIGGQPAPTAPAQPEHATATQTTPEVQTLPQTGLTNEQTAEIVMGVYAKCYNHIFTNCQRLLNSDVGFQNPDAVITTPVVLTDSEVAVVPKADAFNAAGTWQSGGDIVNCELRGFIMKNTKLPAYKLFINMNGHQLIRLLLPQNPATNSRPALQARGGSCLMWVMEGDDAITQAGGKKFLFKYLDGQVSPC